MNAPEKLELDLTEPQHTLEPVTDWWRSAVIYQVYPRSFCDTNDDGIGDIRGIISKLDYIADLGVDVLWVSPFFKSPMKDFGYDISDYRDVDPIFGSLDDFDELIGAAQQRKIKVMIDQVLNHTSDQHPWFIESRSSRTNPKADWYVWADAKEDGSEPNNWISIFGGSAWQWDDTRQQYYLHNFLTSQPDLNFHCDELRAQILHEIEFWLKRGVSGLRLDAINFCYHDQLLRDNPVKPVEERTGRGFSPDNPYAAQYHIYDNTQDDNLAFLESVRALLDRYPNTVALGEINSDDSLKTLSEYTQGSNRLHMGYNFELLADEFSSQYIKSTVRSLESVIGEGWACWALSNHDVIRVVSRWGSGQHNHQFAKMALSLAGSLRGTLCVYQGEELGFTEATIAEHQLQDPFGIKFWPTFKGRDGCRTPIAWNTEAPANGFSNAEPWLPIAPEHVEYNVEAQLAQPDSVLNFYRQFLNWRAQQNTLVNGDIDFIDAPDGVLIIKRSTRSESLYACFNLTDQPISCELPKPLIPVSAVKTDAIVIGQSLELQAYGFCYLTEFSEEPKRSTCDGQRKTT